MKKNFFRIISLSLVLGLLFACSACKEEKISSEISSETDNELNSSLNVECDFTFKDVDASAMFDGNGDTYWLADTEDAVEFEFSAKEELTFNAIKLKEYGNYLSEFILEIKQGNTYIEVCRLDEIGVRTAILDETYKASDFKLTVTMSNATGGISEMEFITAERVENTKDFRNVGYFCTSSLESIRESSYDKISGYTDIILFDYGSWNENGEFLWGSMYEQINEDHLAQTLKEIRALNGTKDLRIWFCLQNYDKANDEDTERLFKTAASRENLANFAVSLCKKYGFYGIDIDYEYPGSASAWQNYDAFLSVCAEKLHKNGYKFSCALSPWGIKLNSDIAPKIDYVNVMAYDYFNFGDNRHASYALSQHCLTYFTELGFKSEQLILGIPFYRRTMDATHQHGGGYNTIAERWRKGVKPWVNVVTNKTWVYYFNGPNMVRDKVYFAMNNKMGGVFCWSMRNDIANNNPYGLASLGQTVIDTITRFKG